MYLFRVDRETTRQICTSGVTFVKVEGEKESFQVKITHSLSVNEDFSWHVVAGGKQLCSTSGLLSTMPQLISCARDVLLIIEFLDSLVPRCGNKDRNTQALQVINTTCLNIRGNCRGSNKTGKTTGVENVSLTKRKTKHSMV